MLSPKELPSSYGTLITMQKNMNDLISVIIPCRNGENYLAEAVASVRTQDISSEIIVVDDGSTDGTAKLAEGLSCFVVSQPSLGPSAARNAALKVAKGDFVLFLDHDDLLCEGALASLLEAFDAQTDVVSANLQDFISPELSEPQRSALVPRMEPYGGLLTGAYLFRRNAVERVGGFDENLKGGGEVVDFLLRCGDKSLNMKKLDCISCRRRLHSTNTGRIKRENQRKDYTNILRMKLRR